MKLKCISSDQSMQRNWTVELNVTCHQHILCTYLSGYALASRLCFSSLVRRHHTLKVLSSLFSRRDYFFELLWGHILQDLLDNDRTSVTMDNIIKNTGHHEEFDDKKASFVVRTKKKDRTWHDSNFFDKNHRTKGKEQEDKWLTKVLS